jgi:hypothetical protein
VRTMTGEAGVNEYEWDGKTDGGEVAPAGVYLVDVTAYDVARNKGQVPALPLKDPGSVPGAPGVTVRTLAVQPPVRSVRAGDPVNLRIDARGRGFDWSLRRLGAGKVYLRGHKDPGKTSLLLRAPSPGAGLYLLRVESHGERTTVPIAVHARATEGPLVVLPMISWLGRDPVDQSGDGLADVFGGIGAAVRFPRLFAFPDGFPPGLRSQIAPVLTYLDERGIRYDLATDLDLAFGAEPTEDRVGVLMAGEPTYISRQVGARLRGYVASGGRIALFGPDALRATVTVGDAVLARPSAETAVDALGGRLGGVRPLEHTLTVLAEDPTLGLLEGFSGQLGGFDAVEELTDPGQGEVKTSVGEETEQLRPVISAVAQGQGLVLRVGLPGWGARLRDGDAPVEQLTANIIDILRHVKPKPRTARG